MGGKSGILFLLFWGLALSCDARNPIFLEPFESAHENQVCELCDKYVTLAIDYLQDDDNQNALCLSMVDHYTQLLFTQVSVIKSDQICKKLNFCQAMTALPSQGNCEACLKTVSEVVTKLKDPETKLKIIRLLLKECKSLNNYQEKCKKMVFEYGPMMLVDLEKFLEKKDVCSIIGVCPGAATHRGYVHALDAVADS